MTHRTRALLTGAIALLLSSSALALEIPKGWIPAGTNPAAYDMGLVKEGAHGGKACAIIRSKAPNPKGFGTLMQNADPKPFLKKRVRLSAWVKGTDVAGWAGLWLRVDQGPAMLAFDNMGDRPLKGSFDWQKVEVVLDVEAGATNLSYGVLIYGTGTVWFDDVKFEPVSKKVKLTGKAMPKPEPPRNLDFEQK